MHVFRDRLSISVDPSVPFGFEGRMWDLIVLIPDHCLSIYCGHCCSIKYREPAFFVSFLRSVILSLVIFVLCQVYLGRSPLKHRHRAAYIYRSF